MRHKNWITVLWVATLTACAPTRALEPGAQANMPMAVQEVSKPNPSRLPKDDNRPRNWQTRFTFEGQVRPGPYAVDPNVWVYTKEFAERFGMPMEWVSPDLKGVEAAAWSKVKTGGTTCGWGGNKEACKENENDRLTLFFDTTKSKSPWRIGIRDTDYAIQGAVGYLSPQKCETRRKPSESTIARAMHGDKNTCNAHVEEQPFADSDTGADIFWFGKGIAYAGQGNLIRVGAYDKSTYPRLAWVQMGYTRPVGLFNPPEAAVLTLEARDAPLGKTLKKYHEIILPEGFDRRIKAILDSQREAEREFYKKSLNMK